MSKGAAGAKAGTAEMRILVQRRRRRSLGPKGVVFGSPCDVQRRVTSTCLCLTLLCSYIDALTSPCVSSASARYGALWRGFRDARRVRMEPFGSATQEHGPQHNLPEAKREARGARGRSSMYMTTIWDLQGPEEWEFEEEVQKVEARLSRAVRKEKYADATKARDELYRMHMDETSAVLAANSQFYTAFSEKDFERMSSLWLKTEDVTCIHPGDSAVRGHAEVCSSWKQLFASGDKHFMTSIIKPVGVRVSVRGTTAIVQCSEEVSAGERASKRAAWLEQAKRTATARVVELGDGRKEGRKASTAGRGRGSSGSISGKKTKPRTLLVTNIYRKAGSRWLMVHHHASVPPAPQTGLELRASMGGQGIQLGEGTEGLPRIINLSDPSFTGTGIEGLDEMLESLRAQLPGSGASFSLGNAANLGNRLQARGMLVIGDDDDKDEEEVEEIEEVSSEPDAWQKGWRSAEGRPLTENLTKKTMQTLRRLGHEKLLDRREQQRLITDVIKHAFGDNASAVEVAYELLLAHSNEDLKDHASLTEFVEQCKMLASSLFEEDRRNRRWR